MESLDVDRMLAESSDAIGLEVMRSTIEPYMVKVGSSAKERCRKRLVNK